MLMRYAYDEYIQLENETQSALSSSFKYMTFNYSETRSFTIRHSATIELWQEVYYPPQPPNWLAHVPPPNWGSHPVCRFVIVTALPLDYQTNDPTITPLELMFVLFQLKQLRQQGNDNQVSSIVVPFYSRIGDSRLCPIGAYRPELLPNS
jgi:hypothetical protein